MTEERKLIAIKDRWRERKHGKWLKRRRRKAALARQIAVEMLGFSQTSARRKPR